MCRWHCPIQAVTPCLLYFLVLCQGMLHWVLLLSRTSAQHSFGLWIGCCIADSKLSRRELTLKALFTSVAANLQGCHLQLCWAALILNHLPTAASPPPSPIQIWKKLRICLITTSLGRKCQLLCLMTACWLCTYPDTWKLTGKSSPVHTHICNLLWIES